MKPILIAGERRSGTTFLANLLNSQEGITIVPNIFVEFYRNPIENKWNDNNYEIDFNKKIDSKEKKFYLNQIKNTLNAFDKGKTINIDITDDSFSTLSDLYNYCLSKIPSDINSKYVGHKVDRPIINNIKNAIKLFNIKVIYIYRDPRDVVLSARHKWPHNSSIKTMKKWDNAINQVLSFENKNILLVKHEDLINKKTKTISEINLFLECNINTNIKKLLNYNDKWDIKHHSSFNDINKPFDTSAINRWKKDPEKLIYQYCAKYGSYNLNQLNYPESKQINKSNEIAFIIYDISYVILSKIKLFYKKRKFRTKRKLYSFYKKLF